MSRVNLSKLTEEAQGLHDLYTRHGVIALRTDDLLVLTNALRAAKDELERVCNPLEDKQQAMEIQEVLDGIEYYIDFGEKK